LSSRAIVSETVAPLLRQHGFKKDRLTWRREEPESILVLNFQHSQWSDLYYINLGVFFRTLDVNDKPSSHHCHLQVRLDTIAGDPTCLAEACDFESGLPQAQRAAVLQREISQSALPWLSERATLSGTREALLQGTSALMVFTRLREHLQLP
jgi:hypothetical protein